MSEAGKSDNAGGAGSSESQGKAPLTDPTTGEERTPLQSRSKNRPPPPAHPSTPFSNQTYHPTSSEISFNQQVVYLNFFGPSSSHPSPQPNPLTLHPPSADTQDTSALVTVAGDAVLLMGPSELAALAGYQPILVPSIHMVTPDHSTAELVSGRVLPYPVGLPVVHGDGLDCTAVKNSVTREDYC